MTVRQPVMRKTGDRIVAGIAAGIADHLGVDRRWIRVAFLVSGLVGIGVVIYGLAVVLAPGDDGSQPPAKRLHLRGTRDFVAAAVVVVGAIQFLGAFASNWRVLLVVSVVSSLLVMAVVTALPTGDDPELHSFPSWLPPAVVDAVRAVRARRSLLIRTVVGGVVATAGVSFLLLGSRSWSQLGEAFVELTLVFAGVTLAFGPWISRLGTDLMQERRDRIRDQERAEMAAHLHDSVLQTLALVQRNASDPREVARLARVQERELRSWLLHGQPSANATGDRAGSASGTSAGSFSAAIDDDAGELEALHTTAIDVVHVRDCQITDRLHALAAATREAMMNAQRHAGVERISVYTEVAPREVRVFVRDRGCGFIRDQVPSDRGGLTESIEGRMRRNGGSVAIRSVLGVGTEVELVMPREPAG